ncbi:MAG TPA: hypothetical protein LFW20_06060 [Rickettsia endosymbiont of Omalisus fontisbellaquei]|nr:hypothetical protein [Rickettsia endosymbiont of Omalisus fontisbellaquei]
MSVIINKDYFWNFILWTGMFITMLFMLFDNKPPLNTFNMMGILSQELANTALWKKMELQQQKQLEEIIKQNILELQLEKK